jgi:hypothetical protein
VANNNGLVLGAIGCLFLTGLAGLSCMGLGGIGWYLHSRPVESDVARVRTSTAGADLLAEAAFLDVSAGAFAAPVAAEGAIPVEAVEAVEVVEAPVVRRRAAAAVAPEAAPSEPPPPAEEEPIISDEDVKALDAEVQQIQEANEAAATETKKKKKNR